MKALYSILLVLFSITQMTSQNFPLSNAYWHCGNIGFVGIPVSEYYYLCGDTVINNINYQKLFAVFTDFNGNIQDAQYVTSLRTDGAQVFFNGGATPSAAGTLLYDFSLEAGDIITLTLFYGGTQQMTVAQTYFQDIEGDIRKFIVFEPLAGITEVWIEGIGSSRGLLSRGVHFVADYDPFGVCFQHEGIFYNWSQPHLTCDLPGITDSLPCPVDCTFNDVAFEIEGNAVFDGNVAVTGNLCVSGQVATPSDRRLKEGIRTLENSLEKIVKINPVSYHFKTTAFPTMELPDGIQYGVIAQELETVFPDFVLDNVSLGSEEMTIKTVNYNKLIPVLVSAVQELNTELKEKDAEIEKLKAAVGEMEAIKARLQALEKGE